MRSLLLVSSLCFSLISPIASAHEVEQDDTYQGSLIAHEHGRVQLNIAVTDNTVEISIDSAAINILGFEHLASAAQDKQLVNQVQQQLNEPHTLFALPQAANCEVTAKELKSPIFDAMDDSTVTTKGQHLDIEANYSFICYNMETLTALDFSHFFKIFPHTHIISLQYVDENKQTGMELTPAHPIFKLQ